jgi:putative nucleotidyltransferase with HDIG domain
VFGAEMGPFAMFVNNNFFLVGTMALVVFSSYLATRMRVNEFLARQQLARANSELRQLDRLKSEFFANISHEVRTPLTSVISPVQSLYQGDLGSLPPAVDRLISQSYRNALRLLDTINQMLDFAKFDAGRMQLRLAWTNVAELARESVTLFSEVAERKGIALEYTAVETVPGAYLDREKTERVLTNLIRNALKFTEEGTVTVKVGRSQQTIVLSVEDTGIGISTDQLERIFDRFHQVDASTTRKHEGTGLGLALAKEACEIQHGSISVSSKPGRGSVFTVYLPTNLDELEPGAFVERRDHERRQEHRPFEGDEKRKGPRRRSDIVKSASQELVLVESARIAAPQSPQEEALAEQQLRDRESGERVLYVEDNEDLRGYVSAMLSRLGHRVVLASDGQEGLERLSEAEPAVVVSDVMMPRLDGYELLARIKGSDHTRHIPVIMVTAKSEEESKIEILEHGADDYIAKPLNIRELDARIRNLCTMQKYQQALARAEELQKRMSELAMSFSQSLEMRDQYTGEHSWDVLDLGTMIAEELGLEVDEQFRDALLLHDVGKLGIPDRILLKNDRLTTEEWEVMKRHAELGADLLRKFDSFHDIAEVILAHQEHYDGTGYPRGLSGESIPMVARVVAVADAWHAMTGDRPYRSALPVETALGELMRNKRRQFDPRIVDALVDALLRRRVIAEEQLEAAR